MFSPMQPPSIPLDDSIYISIMLHKILLVNYIFDQNYSHSILLLTIHSADKKAIEKDTQQLCNEESLIEHIPAKAFAAIFDPKPTEAVLPAGYPPEVNDLTC